MTTTEVEHFTAAEWRRALAILAIALGGLLLVYWPTAAGTASEWARDPLGHGYLVLPGVLLLAWYRRADLSDLTPRPSLWGALALALLSGCWLMGELTSTRTIQESALLAMVAACVWTVFGDRAIRILVFPLGLLLFGMPLTSRLVPYLQDATARFAVMMLTVVGVPALLQGHVISLPGGAWEVAKACGGINYLVASVAVAYAYAGLVYRSWLHRLGFVAAGAMLALVGNGLRVFLTILVASHGVASLTEGARHYIFGWIVFAIILGILFITCGNWREQRSAEVVRKELPRLTRMAPYRVVVLTAAAIAAAVAPVAAWHWRMPSRSEWALTDPPTVSMPWRLTDGWPMDWQPRSEASLEEIKQGYEVGARRVWLYAAYHAAGTDGVKLTGPQNGLAELPMTATRIRVRHVEFTGQPIEVTSFLMESRRLSMAVWCWYRLDRQYTGDEYEAKLLLARARIAGSRLAPVSLAVATEDRTELDADATLEDFVRHLVLPDRGGRGAESKP